MLLTLNKYSITDVQEKCNRLMCRFVARDLKNLFNFIHLYSWCFFLSIYLFIYFLFKTKSHHFILLLKEDIRIFVSFCFFPTTISKDYFSESTLLISKSQYSWIFCMSRGRHSANGWFARDFIGCCWHCLNAHVAWPTWCLTLSYTHNLFSPSDSPPLRLSTHFFFF